MKRYLIIGTDHIVIVYGEIYKLPINKKMT